MSKANHQCMQLVRVASLCLLLWACGGGTSAPPPNVLDQADNSDPGRVRVFANEPDVSGFDADFIDITTRVDTVGEGGLLGVAFHPEFVDNGQVFLSWTETGVPLVSFVSRFNTVAGDSALDPFSEVEILRLNQNFTNHNGGHIGFGPADGHLYYVFGDFGSGRIWRLVDEPGGFRLDELIDSDLRIASFGQGHDGELYVIDIFGGGLFRVEQGPE
jgi:hypothetical protein